MHCWRISKYPPNAERCEWTSVCDIGTVCAGKILEKEEYLRVENLYLNAIRIIAQCNGVSFFEVTALEPNLQSTSIKVPDEKGLQSFAIQEGSIIGLESALYVAQKVLREEMWCKLVNARMFVHFGYDYYIYIGSEQSAEFERQEIQRMGLFINQMTSPYQ